MSQLEWDCRVVEAFKRALYESIQDDQLPMEPSDFLKNHLQDYQLPDGSPIDLRKSSFKKVGKLLECMSTQKSGEGIIVYQESRTKGHKLITQVLRDQFSEFAPQYHLRRIKRKNEESKNEGTGSATYPKIGIEEVYLLGSNLAKLNQGLERPLTQQCYSIKDVKELINQYFAQNSLEEDAKRGHVKIDPLLIRLVGDCKPDQSQVKKEFIYKNITTNLLSCYVVSVLDQDLVIKDNVRQKFVKGEVPCVQLVAQKLSNKKLTTVSGLDLFLIDYDEFTQHLRVKCASSVSLSEDKDHTLKCPKYNVMIQGQQLQQLEEILVDKYKVPKKYIKSVDLVPGKKKRQQPKK
jgi:translation initiation factor 2D